jgi:hypothetical protein
MVAIKLAVESYRQKKTMLWDAKAERVITWMASERAAHAVTDFGLDRIGQSVENPPILPIL